MFWLLIKILLFVVVIVGFIFGVGYLMESDGGVMLIVVGVEYMLSLLMLVIVLGVLFVVFWVFFKFLLFLVVMFKFINGDEIVLSWYFDCSCEWCGFQVFIEGMMVLVFGEGCVVMDKVCKVECLLCWFELINLIIV